MVVALEAVFAQQAVLATVKSILLHHLSESGQLKVLAALEGAEETYKDELLKLFIRLIEQQNLEVSPDVWEVYYEMKHPARIQARKQLQGVPSKVVYQLPHGKSVTIHECRNTLVEGGETGHRTWESSLALTEFICTHVYEFQEMVGDHPIVELGAGTGLVSLACAKLLKPSTDIIATDGSPAIVGKLQQTVDLNNTSQIRTEVVDWSDAEAVSSLPRNAFVLAGDILYGLESLYPVILDMLIALKPARVWFCNPIRNLDVYTRFKQVCMDRNFSLKTLAKLPAASREDTEYMYVVSVPPIWVELVEIQVPQTDQV